MAIADLSSPQEDLETLKQARRTREPPGPDDERNAVRDTAYEKTLDAVIKKYGTASGFQRAINRSRIDSKDSYTTREEPKKEEPSKISMASEKAPPKNNFIQLLKDFFKPSADGYQRPERKPPVLPEKPSQQELPAVPVTGSEIEKPSPPPLNRESVSSETTQPKVSKPDLGEPVKEEAEDVDNIFFQYLTPEQKTKYKDRMTELAGGKTARPESADKPKESTTEKPKKVESENIFFQYLTDEQKKKYKDTGSL